MALQRNAESGTFGDEPRGTLDRRRLPRMLLDHPVVCELEGELVKARAKSISGEGMLLETERGMAPGTRLEVRIGPPLTLNRPFQAVMVVTRVEELIDRSGARHLVAGRFTSPAT